MKVPRLISTEAYDIAPRIAVSITGATLLCYFGVAVTYVVRAQPTRLQLALGLVLLGLLLTLQLGHSFPRLVPAKYFPVRVMLAIQAALTYVPFVLLEEAWLGMPGFLAGSALLRLRPLPAWICFFLVILATDLILVELGHGLGAVAYTSVATGLTGIVVFGMSRLTGLVGEVYASRVELAELAIAQERLRFARDLHDLLGYSLSTITLKGELAYRLIPEEHQRAREEIRDLLQASRRALGDVRAVAQGYVAMSLTTELQTAESLLAALGIRVESDVEPGELPSRVDALLATVLREGLTNILRHTKATNCRIEAWRKDDQVWLVMWNDGAGGQSGVLSADDDAGGSGIGNLRARVESFGGSLGVTSPERGTFQLAVQVPLLPKSGCSGAVKVPQPAVAGCEDGALLRGLRVCDR
ncbi:sensor histidine kinase [Streptomyces sp. NPDC087659]|uniref:sensor histidine kinase n=1 Tax=Streptomyces sp. NPDC087659 TaxID=3365801 RepID=UPI003821ACEF